jgi:toxin ParE1/3/4
VRVRLLDEADAEAEEAARWYEQREAGLGFEFLDSLAAVYRAIEDQPERFARLETAPAHRNVHRYLLERFPYYVVYEILANEVVVLAVAHGRRRPNYWKKRKPQ